MSLKTPDRDRQEFDLERGLYVVSYLSSTESRFPPTVYMSASDATVSFVRHPDSQRNILSKPGNCLILRIERKAKVAAEIVAAIPLGSIDAKLDFQVLPAGSIDETDLPERVSVVQSSTNGLRVKGHLTAVGDTTVGPNEWLGGPNDPLRIEGLSLKWFDQPNEAELKYAAKTAMDPPGSPWRMAGNDAFVGSRGNSAPILELLMELSFASTRTHRLVGEAQFLGSPLVKFEGQRINVHGPTKREPLVGLKLDVRREVYAATIKRSDQPANPAAHGATVQKPTQPAPVAQRPVLAPPAPEPAGDGTATRRVRVFKK